MTTEKIKIMGLFETEAEVVAAITDIQARGWGVERVLGADHEKRFIQLVRLTFDGDLVFFHRFEQGALGLGCCSIDFIGEDEVREHRAGMKLENLLCGVEDRNPENVGRQ